MMLVLLLVADQCSRRPVQWTCQPKLRAPRPAAAELRSRGAALTVRAQCVRLVLAYSTPPSTVIVISPSPCCAAALVAGATEKLEPAPPPAPRQQPPPPPPP